MKAEEEAHIADELRLKYEEEEQSHLKAEEEVCIDDELWLKAEDRGFCGVGVER